MRRTNPHAIILQVSNEAERLHGLNCELYSPAISRGLACDKLTKTGIGAFPSVAHKPRDLLLLLRTTLAKKKVNTKRFHLYRVVRSIVHVSIFCDLLSMCQPVIQQVRRRSWLG